MEITCGQFHAYCGSNTNFAYLAAACYNLTTAATPALGKAGIVNTVRTLTAKECHKDEWLNLTQKQKDWLRHQEKLQGSDGYKETYQVKLQAKIHYLSNLVNINDVIDSTINTHEVEISEIHNKIKESDSTKDVLLAHMVNWGSLYGDIHNFLSENQRPYKNKDIKQTKLSLLQTLYN
jgi:hypothetical protein